MSRFRPRLNYANVISSLALFAVLGGTAYAHGMIGPGDIQRGAIQSAHVDRGTVKPAHISRGSIRPIHMPRGAVRPAHIVPNGIVAPHIRAGAVGPSQIAGGAVGASKIAGGAVGTSKIAEGAVGSSKIAGGAVGPSQIAEGAVGTDQLSGGAAGVALAGVQVAADHTTVVSSFNRFGGPPSVQVDGAGAAIEFPGLDLNPADFVHQATMMGNQHGEIRVRNSNFAGSIRVLTGNSDGVNDRRPFSYTVYGTP